MVLSVRTLAAGGAAEADLEEKLIAYGYLDTHQSLYATTGYTVREHAFYRVVQGFPRLVETDLIDGVGGVQYHLVIAACAAHRVDDASAYGILRGKN